MTIEKGYIFIMAIKLKDQEVRNCVYRGRFNDMLKDSNNYIQISNKKR